MSGTRAWHLKSRPSGMPTADNFELKEMDLDDVVVERAVLELMEHAENRRSIRVINGLVPGNLTRALEGEDVGTLITAD